MRKIIIKYKMYLQPLHMCRQINGHPQGVSIKEFQSRTASKNSIVYITASISIFVHFFYHSVNFCCDLCIQWEIDILSGVI
jgi:hypothetical protein